MTNQLTALRGAAHCFGDDINTDYVISSKYKTRSATAEEMAQFFMEDIDPGLVARIRAGDILVAGRNFGCGSSRETAPRVIKAAGIGAVLAKSFARIFFRNAVNVGLPVFSCDTSGMVDGDRLAIDAEQGRIRNETRGETIEASPLSPVMRTIIADGGLAAHIRKHGTFRLDLGGARQSDERQH